MDIARRDLAGLAVGIAAATPALARPVAAASPTDPTLQFVFSGTVMLGAPLELGVHGGARRRFVSITGGIVTGPKISGVILPGGGDWQEIGDDGMTDIHARYMLRLSDGTIVGVDNPGVRTASADIIKRLTAGEDIDPALYYFRTCPRFEVAAGPHDWLRRSVFVCQGIRHPTTVELRIFRVS